MSNAQQRDVEASTRKWELSEDAGGFLRSQSESGDDITHVFTPDGTLLTESAGNTPSGVTATHAPTAAGGRLGRLLRFYIGNAGRRVVLQDRRGERWQARITGTRWQGKAAGRSWFLRSNTATPTRKTAHHKKEA